MKKRALEKFYQDFFYVSKDTKVPDKVFRSRMTFSLLTILACVTVMMSSAFALFFADITTDVSTLKGAYYSVTVDNAANGTYICPLIYEDKHIFEIKAEGTATTGYCKIQVDEQVYYTDQIPPGGGLFLIVKAAEDTVITFTPQWGMSSYYINEDPCGNEITYSSTPYAFYKVEPTAKLADIAAYYNVDEADILTYNNITEITAGTELKIPGVSPDTVSYVAPVTKQPVKIGENNDVSPGDNTVSDGDADINK